MTLSVAESPGSQPADTANWAAPWMRRAVPIAITVAVSFGIVALQLAQGILLARLLGPQGRGEYATAVLYVQFVLYIGLFGAVEVVCRYAADEQVDRASLRRSAFRLALITSGITTAFTIVCSFVGLPADKQYLLPLALICSLSILGQQTMLILSAVDRGSGDFARYNWLRLVAAAAFPLLLSLWALVAQTTLWSTCVLLTIASLISTGACFIGHRDTPAPQPAPAAPVLFREGRPYAASMLATDAFERLDLLLMLWFAPLVTQGFYNAMIPVAYPLTVLPNTVGIFLFNAGARKEGGLSTRRVSQILVASVAIQAIMTIGFLLLVGPVVNFVYGDEFLPAVTFAMWLAPVAAIKGIAQGLDSYVKGRGRPLASIRIRVFSAIVMLVAIAALYPVTGILSIVQGSLVGQVVCFLGLAAIVYSDAQTARSASTTS
ncbi:MAG: lipopolysaccharide biosynthesis protein [Planctomycetaceae bacterium]